MRIGQPFAVVLIVLLTCLPSPAAEQPRVDFARDVQPILKSRCFSCHDGRKHKAGLRLDVRASALRGGESGKPALVRGDSKKSELLRRVTSRDEDEVMPPSGEPLSEAQVKLLRAWIDSGAVWPDALAGDDAPWKRHWAFRAPVRPSLPSIHDGKWPRNPLDRFVLARLEKEGLKPSLEAERVTLIRRLSLDLIGLPPTIEEVDAFLADKSDQAYEKVVERLLSSPHYGERWGRHWLDAARYADSDGFEKDKLRQVWFYRDWVINALNRDLPYDQFIIEQLAGDLLPGATQDQKVATGFLRNSMINEEGGVDPEQFRMEANFDRMHAIGSAILGLTIQCAQCHNHKFDPLKQEEYYRMMAFINQTHEANIAVYTPDEEIARTEILRRTREMEGTLKRHNRKWQARMAAWEEQVKANQPEWTVIRPTVDDISTGGERYIPQKDGSFLELGYSPTHHKVKLTLKTDVRNITAIRLELLTDPELPRGGPGRSAVGSCAVSEFQVEAAPASDPKKVTKVKFASATADIDMPATPLQVADPDKAKKQLISGPADFAIDGKDETAWSIDAGPGLRNQPRKIVFTAATPIDNPGGTILTFQIAQDHAGDDSDKDDNNNIGKMRLSITVIPSPNSPGSRRICWIASPVSSFTLRSAERPRSPVPS